MHEKLIKARDRLGFTQTQMAKELGVTTRCIQAHESGSLRTKRYFALAVNYVLLLNGKKTLPIKKAK